jgi:hypothetical protein
LEFLSNQTKDGSQVLFRSKYIPYRNAHCRVLVEHGMSQECLPGRVHGLHNQSIELICTLDQIVAVAVGDNCSETNDAHFDRSEQLKIVVVLYPGREEPR